MVFENEDFAENMPKSIAMPQTLPKSTHQAQSNGGHHRNLRFEKLM